MKPNRVSILVFLFLSFIPLSAFAQQGPIMLSGNRSLRIVEAGKAYSMAEFTPQMPLKIEVQGPGRLIVYIKTAVYQKYNGLPAFRLFVKKDGSITNQYLFPKTTRSNASFEGIKDYSPSAEMNSIPIDVPEGVHTYEIYLSQKPYIIGLASFGYTPQPAAAQAPAARQGSFMYARNQSSSEHGGAGKWFYIKPYGMAGDVYEQGTNNNSVYGGIGINADLFVQKHIAVSGIVNYTDADQSYLVWRNLPLPLGAGMYVVNEQTLLIQGVVSYVPVHDDRTIVMIGAGWGDLELINPAFPGEVDGPLVSALFERAMVKGIRLSFRPSYMQDVSNISANTNSMLGTPSGFLMYPVGLAFGIASGISIEVGYDGRLLTFQDTNRFYNGGFVAALF
jgi:hypothetical protein